MTDQAASRLNRLRPAETTDAPPRHRRRAQALKVPAKQLPVHHLGAHAPLHRGIGLIGKLVSQTRPDVIVHQTKYRSGQQTHTRAAMNQASFRREAAEDASAYLPELPGRRWEPTVGGSGRA